MSTKQLTTKTKVPIVGLWRMLCVCILMLAHSFCYAQIDCELSGWIDTTKNEDTKNVFNTYHTYLLTATKNDFSLWNTRDKQRFKIPDLILGDGIFSPTIYKYHYRFQVTDIRPEGDDLFIITTLVYTTNDSVVTENAELKTLCIKENGTYSLSNFINYHTTGWVHRKIGRINYHYFPGFPFDDLDAALANKTLDSICSWFNIPRDLTIEYFIARDCDEIYKIRGYNFVGYNAGKYRPLCGFFDNNVVFSNAREGANYQHELAHVINEYYPDCNDIIKIGLSAYINTGKSGHLGKPIAFHIRRVNEYLQKHPELSLEHFTDFTTLDDHTNPQYSNGTIIIDNLLKKGGLPLLLQCMKETKADDQFYAFVKKHLLSGTETMNHYMRHQYQLLAADKNFTPLLTVEK